jgi:hypothetical protein
MTDDENIKEENQDRETQAPEVLVNEAMIPVKNPGISIREEMEEDGKYILFNAENEIILVINPTGRFILDHCDGEKSIAGIIETIGKNFNVSEDVDLSTIVKNYVSLLLKAELITLEEEG